MKHKLKFSHKLLLLMTVLIGSFFYGCGENPFGSITGGGNTGGGGNPVVISANFDAEITNNPLAVQFTNESLPRNTPQKYEWDFGDGAKSTEQNPLHEYSKAGTYNVVLTVVFGKSITRTKTHTIKLEEVIVAGKVTASFSNSQLSPKIFAFTNTTFFENMSEVGVQYLWDFGDGSAVTPVSVKGVINHEFPDYQKSYTVTLMVQKGVEILSQASATVTTGAEPVWKGKAGFDYSPKSIKTGDKVSFTNTTTLYELGLTYLWNIDGKILSTEDYGKAIENTFSAGGSYLATLTVYKQGKILDTISKPILVTDNVDVVPGFTFAPVAGANNKKFTFTNTTSATGVSGLVYYWNFNDGTTLTKTDTMPFEHDFKSFGITYNVVLTVKKGTDFYGEVSKSVTTDAAPSWDGVVGFTYSPLSPITSGTTVTFTNTSTKHKDGLSYVWNYGDGSPTETKTNTTSVSHTYSTPGTYKAKLTATFGGSTPVSKEVDIIVKANVNVTPDFTFVQKVSSAKIFTFTNTTKVTGIADSGFEYIWDFSLISIPKTNKDPFDYEFSSYSKQYTVTLTVKKGSEIFGSVSKTVTTGAAPAWSGVANFNYTPASPVTVGTLVTFNNTTSGHVAGVNYEWSFGDGQVLTETSTASVTYTYTTANTYTITLKATLAGVVKTKTASITVNAASGGGGDGGGTGGEIDYSKYAWSASKTYDAEGYVVVHEKRYFKAQWWTQGNTPGGIIVNTWDSPWAEITKEEFDRLALLPPNVGGSGGGGGDGGGDGGGGGDTGDGGGPAVPPSEAYEHLYKYGYIQEWDWNDANLVGLPEGMKKALREVKEAKKTPPPSTAESFFTGMINEQQWNELFPRRRGAKGWQDDNPTKPNPGDYYSYASFRQALKILGNYVYFIEVAMDGNGGRETNFQRNYVLNVKTGQLRKLAQSSDYYADDPSWLLSRVHKVKIVDYNAFGTEGTDNDKKRIIAGFLAHASHETSGSWATAPGWAFDKSKFPSAKFPDFITDQLPGELAWSLYFNEEVGHEAYLPHEPCISYTDLYNKDFPATKGQSYHGRGAFQLSWNYNYGLASGIFFGTIKTLLDDPNMIVNGGKKPGTWIEEQVEGGTMAFMTSLMFWLTPQGEKPSQQDTMVLNRNDGLYVKGTAKLEEDVKRGIPGYGWTVNIMNGGYEAGKSWIEGRPNYWDKLARRVKHYLFFTQAFGGNNEGEVLDTDGKVSY